MSERAVSADFDEMHGHARTLDDYAQGITADTRAADALLAGYRTGYGAGSYEDVGMHLAHARQVREQVGHALASEARDQAAAARNTVQGFTDIDTDIKASMDRIGDGDEDLIGPNGVGRISDIQSGISGPYTPNAPTESPRVVAQMPEGVPADPPITHTPAAMPPVAAPPTSGGITGGMIQMPDIDSHTAQVRPAD
jgi:hypothetical protein